jgi:hypothetical protein
VYSRVGALRPKGRPFAVSHLTKPPPSLADTPAVPYRLLSLFLILLLALPAFPATQGGSIPVPLPLFPPNNWWNVDISNAPTVANSSVYYPFMGGSTRGLHPDFGGDAGGGDVYGFPYIIVDGSQPKKVVDFVEYPSQSDGVGQAFYPIPDEAITQGGWIEGGQPGNVDQGGDRHMLIVDATNNDLYELYHTHWNGTNWEAGSGAFFDMDTNNRRPETWTSADAAGLAILPGLVRYDEVFGPDEIRHAFRVTVSSTNGHVFPASHTAGSTSGALPMGARMRLKADKNISGFAPEIQKIFRAMKKYGLIVADNGSNMYVSGVYDTRWNNDILNPAFAALKAGDFEIIQLGWHPPVSLVLSLPANMGNGDAASATLTAYNSNFTVATGYTGTVQFTSTDGAATLPLNYTFTAGDAGTHTFPAGFILRTPGSHVVTVTDVANAQITGSDGVTVGPPAPTGLVATAVSATQVNLTWNPSSGATQYEVVRGSNTIATVSSPNYNDGAVSSGQTAVYKVRALDSAGRPSPYSAPDAATTLSFTDDPLVSGTRIKAVHIIQLRLAVNSMRAAAGLSNATFTGETLSGARIKAIHIRELRDALAPARATLGLSAVTYTNPVLSSGIRVKAVHVQELRNAVK